MTDQRGREGRCSEENLNEKKITNFEKIKVFLFVVVVVIVFPQRNAAPISLNIRNPG